MIRTVSPETPEDAAATLAACANAGEAIVFEGGSTLQSLGNAPHRCDVVVRTTGLHGFAEYDPRDMTAGVQAGTTLADIARVLGEFGQWIPFDAPLPARATLGGTLAAGWAGPRRGAYGRPRDLVIGSTIALADGTLASAGGMVVKNVTGYDMSKLYVGSFGTLGMIVRANLKALPRPAARRLAVAPLADDVRERAVAAAGALTVEPSAALVIDGFPNVAKRAGADVRLVMLFEGSEAAVDRATRDARSALGKAGVAETALIDGDTAESAFAEIVDAYIEVLDERSLTYRIPGRPSTAWSRSRTAAELASFYRLTTESISDIRTGDAIVRYSAPTAAAFAGAALALDERLRSTLERTTVLAGAPGVRATIDAWGKAPSTIETMRAIKAHFDPAGILAPGRYVGAI